MTVNGPITAECDCDISENGEKISSDHKGNYLRKKNTINKLKKEHRAIITSYEPTILKKERYHSEMIKLTRNNKLITK